MNANTKPIYMAQLSFFDMVKKSKNRSLLSKVALNLGDRRKGYEVELFLLMNSLIWAEYQSVLSMLSLRANVTINWDEEEMTNFEEWAKEGQ